MNKILLVGLFALIYIVFSVVCTTTIWPMPNQFTITGSSTTFSTNPTIQKFTEPLLNNAVERYVKIIFGTDAGKSIDGNVKTWNIRVDDLTAPLSLNSDESYSLEITSNQVNLNAKQVWGALRGLESLSQLVTKNSNGQYESILAEISDRPRYPWRGLMIDVARHFLSPRTIKRMIDGMAYNKLNVLHLHLADAESFPLYVSGYPDLSNKGAWNKDLVYTPEILKDIVDYAYQRGIRVIPEIDIPGHTYSWGKGYPEARANCTNLIERTKNINNGALHLGKEISFALVQAIINQLSDVFKDEFIHLGGDEVVTACWREDTSINTYMNQHNMRTYDDFEGAFEQVVETYYRQKGKRMISWQELSEIQTSFWRYPNDSIIQVWKEAQDLPKYVGRGNKIILSGGWYLDKSVPDSSQNPPYLFGDNWKNMYVVDPAKYLTPQQAQLVIGGEVAQWGEQIDEYTVDARIWPRAAAVAERLWSPAEVVDTVTAQDRLIRHRCEILVKRGINAFPLRPDYCPYTWEN